MIRTTTTIRANQVSRGDIAEQVGRVAELVRQANDDLFARELRVEFRAGYASGAPAAQDKIEAKVVVAE